MPENSSKTGLGRTLDWKFWAGLIISALFLYIAIRRVDLLQVWNELRSVSPFPIAAAIAILLAQQVCRALRWRFFLTPIKATQFKNRLLAILVGFAANCLLPARLGEFLRANYLGVCEKCSRSSAFGTIIIERLFDAFTLLGILYVGLLATDFSTHSQNPGAWLGFAAVLLPAAYGAVILLLVGFKWKAHACVNILNAVLFFLPQALRSRLTQAALNFSLGIVPLKAKAWAGAILYSCLIWTLGLLQVKAVAMSLGLHIPFMSLFLILAIASMGAMIPSAPGFIGTFHWAVQFGFMLHGFSPEKSLSAAILLHAVFYLPTVILGVWAFLLMHIPLNRLAADSGEAVPHNA